MTDPVRPSNAEPGPTPPDAAAESTPPPPDLGDRMKSVGDELNARGQQLGREAQAAADRWSRDPGVVHVADTASRAWGLLLLLVGLYFFVQVTLGYALPDIPWGQLWPLALVALGLLMLARGMTRRA